MDILNNNISQTKVEYVQNNTPNCRNNAFHNGREGNYNNEVTLYNVNLLYQPFRFIIIQINVIKTIHD